MSEGAFTMETEVTGINVSKFFFIYRGGKSVDITGVY